MFARNTAKKEKKIAEKSINNLKSLKSLLIKGAEKGGDNTKYIAAIEEFVNKTLVPIVTRYLGN